MDAPSALALLQSRGLSVRLDDGALRVGPSDRIDDGLRELIRRHRAGLVELVGGGRPAPGPGADGPLADLAPDFDAGPPEPPGVFLGHRTVAAADCLASVRAGVEHNAAVLSRATGPDPGRPASGPRPAAMSFDRT